MKNRVSTLVLVLSFYTYFFTFAAFSQDTIMIDDFETGLKSWSAVNDNNHIQFQITTNPSPDDVNSSSNVLKCTRKSGSVSWAGVILRDVLTLNINSDSTGYAYASVKFMKQSRGNVSFKLESGPEEETFESSVVYPETSAWTEIIFDLRSASYGSYSDFFVMVDRADEVSSDMVVYIDEIKLYKNKIMKPIEIDPKSQNGTGEVDGYRLVWQDLFDNNSLNADVWNIEVNGDGGGNNELQYYKENNVSVSSDEKGNGCLIISARKENYGGKQITSGRINSRDKMTFRYGKVEASIRLPKTANGLWPAFWMLGADIATNNWPLCGEIDILEMGHSDAFAKGTQDRYLNGACHWGALENGSHPNYALSTTWNYSLQDDDYHLFTLYWNEEKLEMYIDQDRYPSVDPYYVMTITSKETSQSPGYYFHHPYFLLFNLAVGGDFSHLYDVNEITALSSGAANMYVNYVKVYQKDNSGSSYEGPAYTDMDDFVYDNNDLSFFKNSSGCIYDITGKLLSCFDSDLDSKLQTMEDGIYVVVLRNGERHKICNFKSNRN